MSPRWEFQSKIRYFEHLNPRPADYKSAAIPLSHGGSNFMIKQYYYDSKYKFIINFVVLTSKKIDTNN